MNAVETARRLVERLLAAGTTDAVLSPGSRSGPLALALHAADAQGLLRLHVRVDEREAAFVALGLAKVQGRPVPVVTTSGTAVANLHPALLEAVHSGVPVVAVTADRPARLRGTGANQTTQQVRIFPLVAYADDLEAVRPGLDHPLQLNLELDEPLIEPVSWEFSVPGLDQAPDGASATTGVDASRRTVVVAGDGAGPGARELAESAGWPLLAEPSSGARNGPNAIAAYRLLLRSDLAHGIEQVVSFGHATLSRPVTALLGRTDLDIVHVGDQATFPTPAGPRVLFAETVRIEGVADPGWLDTWRAAGEAARSAIDALLDGLTPYDVARTVDAAVPDGGLLVVGSSNPIRDLDLVGGTRSGERTVLANRGLAGIDGLLSTAIGAALAHGPARAIAYVGDLTFLHGSNGLLIGPGEPRPDLTIVVVNDDGGSIFASLEQGADEYAAAFERVYATPTGADLGALCAGYRVAHRRVGAGDLAAALSESPAGVEVIEVPLDRADRRALGAHLAEAGVAAANSR